MQLVDTTSTHVIFEIVEQNRKINFKKAKPSINGTDGPTLQKIKVLPDKIYDNSNRKAVNKDAVPDFKIPYMSLEVNDMIDGGYYIIADRIHNFTDAEKLIKILHELGVKSQLGGTGDSESYYVYLGVFNSKAEARLKLINYKRAEIKPLTIIKFTNKGKDDARK